MNKWGFIPAVNETGGPAFVPLPGLKFAQSSPNIFGSHLGADSRTTIGTPWYTHVFSISPDFSCSRTPGGDYNTDPSGYTNNNGSFSGSDSAAHDIAQAMVTAGIPYCVIGWNPNGGFGDGLQFCSNVSDPASLTDFELSMAGFGALDLGFNWVVNAPWASPVRPGGLQPPGFKPGGAADIADWMARHGGRMPDGLLMRPTPLSWPGQDPDQDANRLIWRTSEVGAVSWTASGSGSIFGIEIAQGLSGFGLRSLPSRCPPTVITLPVRPGQITAAAAPGGIRPRGGHPG